MATVHEPSPADTQSFPAFWCRCESGPDDAFYSPDFWCKCGIEKHHWHCQRCKGLAQIG